MVSREKAIRGQLPGFRARAATAEQRADHIQALAKENARIPGWQADIRDARGIKSRADEAAARESERGDALGRRQRDLYREADGQRRTATNLREELAGVVGGGSVSETIPPPSDNLEALRTGYRAASEAYQRAEVGADLLAREDRLGKDESAARAAVAALDDRVHGHASRLLLTPEGSDAAARAEAAARSARRVGDLNDEVTAAAENAARLETAYRAFQPQERSLEPYGKPEDIPRGEELIGRATSDWDTAKTELDEARGRLETLNIQLADTRDLVRDFGAVGETLAVLVSSPAEGDTSPFEGTVDAARSRRDEARNALGVARRMLDDAADQVRRAASSLARHAADERFERLATPVRRLLNATEQDRMSEFAAEWEAALRPRFRVLSDELEQIERHRAVIVDRLQGMVTRALGRLKAAQRASRLPADLADWSGLEFLRISFAQPEDAVLAERLGQLIDEVTAPVLAGKAAAKRDGMSILLSGVKSAVQPKGVRVEILKPDAVLRDERIRVGEIGDVFSGGQLLTTAIILYCTMAWLRAGERGQTQRQHAGVLFLDNPIGRASAGYLLALQLTVAHKLGVQVDPATRTDSRRRRVLDGLIAELAAAGEVKLPGARSYDHTETPALPKFLGLGREAVPPRTPRRPVVWHPSLSWVPAVRLAPAQLERLELVNDWLQANRDSLVVPSRERSVEIFGDEKALDRLIGTTLFAPDRLSLELLRCRRVVPRLHCEPVGEGSVLLVVENSDTFDSLVTVLRGRNDHRVGLVGWGAGAGFEASVLSIADLGRAVTEVRYFGDLDENGLRIPASAGLIAQGVGLPPVRPATGLYTAMFARGNPRPGQRRVPADTAASLVAWLDPEHQGEAAELLSGALRLAQEWVGLSHLSRNDDWLRDIQGNAAGRYPRT